MSRWYGHLRGAISRSSEAENFSQNRNLEWRDCVCDLLQILNWWM